MVHREVHFALYRVLKTQPDCCPYGLGIWNFSVSNLITVTIMISAYPSDVRYYVFEWLVRERTESREVLNYLDDFLFGDSNAGESHVIVDIFIDDCKGL